MRRLIVWASAIVVGLSSCAESRIHEKKEFNEVFAQYGITNAAFIMRDHTHDVINYNNLDAVTMRRSPASTFKIPNSLIAIEEAIARDDNFVIKWDSVVRSREAWNKDLTMREAFKESAVPYYQELARRIGKDRMQHYLDTFRYGNKVIGKNVDDFWLNDSLKISADEQLGFMKKLYFNELSLSDRTQRIVRSMMLQDDEPSRKMYYKTGTAVVGDSITYWIVGFTEMYIKVKEHENSMNKSDVRITPYFFAEHFTLPKNDTSKDWYQVRIDIAKEILHQVKAW